MNAIGSKPKEVALKGDLEVDIQTITEVTEVGPTRIFLSINLDLIIPIQL